MGIEALYRKPGAQHPGLGGGDLPVFREHRVIDRPSQVWSSDSTYLPTAYGFLYQMRIIDVAGRKGNRQRSSERLLAEREVRGVYPARRTSTGTRRKDSLLRYKRLGACTTPD